jgi:hypothetical protein
VVACRARLGMRVGYQCDIVGKMRVMRINYFWHPHTHDGFQSPHLQHGQPHQDLLSVRSDSSCIGACGAFDAHRVAARRVVVPKIMINALRSKLLLNID